jgi:hypothetical protein
MKLVTKSLAAHSGLLALAVPGALVLMLLGASVRPAHADYYDNEWIESHYVTQCSMSSANPTVGNISTTSPGYGALNDWRIGNGKADSVDCGTQGIGAVGLLYGYHRLTSAGRSNSDLDTKAKTALSAFFWSWVRNGSNQINQSGRIGFPANASYDTNGNIVSKAGGSAAVTAELLIAMRKYCELSPNGDAGNYQSQEYSLAHNMANYIVNNLSSWTVDRSYAVAAYRCFANWANAVGDTGTASWFSSEANTVSGWLANAQDKGTWRNYYDYLDGGGNGVYNNNNVDQTGFSPYEFNARPANETYAVQVAQWWDYSTAFNGDYLTWQSGRYAGGVCQSVPNLYGQVYPGDSLQLADAEWKIAHADGNQNNQYNQAWWHYNFAMGAWGSSSGSGCWVNTTSVDGYIGGFVDWVNVSNNNRPASWQRFIDTSGYMLVATEELAFSNQVDWSN